MEQETTLDLAEIFDIFRKRLKLIIIITLATTALAGILSYFVIPPTFEAQTSIIIGKQASTTETKNQDTYSDVMMYQSLVKTYGEIIKSDVVAENAAKRLQGKISIEEIQKMMTITPQQNTQIIYIKTHSKFPTDALNVSKAVSDAFIEEATSRIPQGNVQILDEAKLPENPIKPKKMLNIAIGFLIGLMGSVGIAFLLEYMDRTIKVEKDVETYLQIPVIGIIPKETQKA